MNHDHHASHKPTATSDDRVVREYQQVNDRMHSGMAIEFTGDPDIDFLRGMIPHHQGAVDMAHVVIRHGSDPRVRQLAQDIISAQEGEIARMEEWLAALAAADKD